MIGGFIAAAADICRLIRKPMSVYVLRFSQSDKYRVISFIIIHELFGYPSVSRTATLAFRQWLSPHAMGGVEEYAITATGRHSTMTIARLQYAARVIERRVFHAAGLYWHIITA